MRKLYKLKEWYTLDEAAQRLSLTLGEPIETQNVRQLMAAGDVQAYCNVRGVYAIEVAPTSIFIDADSELMRIRSSFGTTRPEDINPFWSNGFSEQTANVEALHGLFKIKLREEPDVSDTDRSWLYSIEDGSEGEYLSDSDVGGDVMLVGDDGRLWELRELDEDRKATHSPWRNAENFRAVHVLPATTEVVLSKSELEGIEARLLDDPAEDRKLAHKERNTLLVVIAALCAKANVDLDKRGVASEIVAMAQLLGVPLDPGTIRTIVGQIPDAVGSRKRAK